MKRENAIEDKSFDFAVRIVNLYKYLTATKNEYIMSKQLIRSGTSIGANVSESQKAQSRADFKSKLHISLKEAYETEYWLRLLYKTDYLTEEEYKSIMQDIREIIALLISIIKKTETKT